MSKCASNAQQQCSKGRGLAAALRCSLCVAGVAVNRAEALLQPCSL